MVVLFFFFKQKTAYEMRISDWSSDVCSSDLRALEGELVSSIQALHAVQSARVHLAIPRESLFVRDRQPPTASVLLTLYPGRSLSDPQVAAITWLVSSSVPHLTADKVSVVEQNGRLLKIGRASGREGVCKAG